MPLSNKDLTELYDALHFMKMEELKEISFQLKLSSNGQKGERIQYIMSFLKTGEIAKRLSLPEISRAKKNAFSPLAPETLLLSGSFKNDTPTRALLKSLVGKHFHFTAFGQDWIKERWSKGNSPTYREFAAYWEKNMKNERR